MRVFLHIGAGKTGTSFIQSTLTRHRAELFAAGLFYARGNEVSEQRAGAGEMNQGNGGLLARYLLPERFGAPTSRETALAWIDEALAEAGGRELLISSEALQFIGREALAELDGLFRARGREMHVIFYMRHLLDVHVAGFAQFAKVGRLMTLPERRRSLDGFIATATTRWPAHIAMLREVVGPERVITRLYDADRADLLGRFLGLIGPGYRAALPEVLAAGTVNRSPNLAEFPLFEAANAVADPRAARSLCRDLANALLNAPPVVEAPPLHVSQDAFARFAARQKAEIEAINRDHLPPETPIQLTSGRVPIGDAPPVGAADLARIAAAAMLRLAKNPSPASVRAPPAPLPPARRAAQAPPAGPGGKARRPQREARPSLG
ncbi:MAG: hypothetical protein ACK44F_10140 [Roseococcus sp.]